MPHDLCCSIGSNSVAAQQASLVAGMLCPPHMTPWLLLLAAADSEGASFSTMPEYVQWVIKACGDPATNKSAECADLKDKLCGTRDTSEVRKLQGQKPGEVPLN